MRNIIASLDIGTHTIKLVVGEIQKNKVNILSSVEVASQGIKKGYVVNPESALIVFQDIFAKTEELIGIPVKKVLVTVPSYGLECFSSKGKCIIKSEDKVITYEDLIHSMQSSVYNQIPDNKELVTILPTRYILNEDEVVENPINMIANKLIINDVFVTIPKKNTIGITKCLEKIGISVIDVCVSGLADYYNFRTFDTDNSVGAVVNIGQSNTSVSIFNKGILTSCEVIDMGASSVDNDIAFVYKISKKDANYVKERLVTTDIHLASPEENLVFDSINGGIVKINQYDVSLVVIERLNELIALIKKQINLLTKKKISYIIITGGITELSQFDNFVESILGNTVRVGFVNEIGARNNKYSIAIGAIKYYKSRLELRNSEFSIFSIEEQEEFGGFQRRVNISDNSLLGKIYGYFFDN